MALYPARAAAAYNNTARSAIPVEPVFAENKASFLDMLQDSARDSVESMEKAEKTSFKAIAGKTEFSDLITAVSNAEVQLNTVVAIRDRVVNAYQEILRMPI